jgi:xanthine dehydrogenase YagR molybdenum-binding subunit
VKLALARQQMFSMTVHRAHTRQRVAIGARPDGTITAIAHDSWVQTAVAQEFIEKSSVISRMMYAGPNRRTTHRAVKLNLPVPGIMRAPGEASGSFALESAMDEIAAALGIDPIALRIKNEPEHDPEKRLPFSSRNLAECLRIGADRFGWARRGPIRSLRDGRWRVGMGVAAATYPTRIAACGARIRLTPNGRAQVKLAATDLGTGTYTILAQIAAETLRLPADAVEVEIGDTDFPSTPGSGGSWMAASAGSAVLQAALAVERKRRSGATGAIEVEIKTKPGDAGNRFAMHAFGAHFVEIGIDQTTCEVRLRRMLGVFAAGRILNIKTARSQLLGGMVMGVGMALGEESIVDPRYGHFVNADLAEYHIPVHADIPETFDALCIEETDEKVNPLGAKGLGELGIVGAAAAVANAVYHATGQRFRNLPITLDKVLPA